jgi:hypothetical protein
MMMRLHLSALLMALNLTALVLAERGVSAQVLQQLTDASFLEATAGKTVLLLFINHNDAAVSRYISLEFLVMIQH